MKWLQVLGLALPVLVNAQVSTDDLQDADPLQSGYLPNHNIGPAQLSSWKVSWTNKYGKAEVFPAQPLVYTPTGSTDELLILTSSFNIVRVIDGITGKLIANVTLDAPFDALDSACTLDAAIGITGTPIIDPVTSYMYFYTKGYFNGQAGPQGTLAGVYKLWALKIPSLAIVPGFPVEVTGPASNDPRRYFIGGTMLQRPGLAMIGDSILAGFGGHCESFNYTGMLVAVSKSGKGVTDMYAMQAGPFAPIAPNLTNGKGGKAGIWHSGMGLATDLINNRIFFATGNGDGVGQNNGPSGPPASGKLPIGTLGSAICNFGVDPVAGTLTQQDYFQPINYAKLNTGDKDISSSGVTLLDSSTFSGGGVSRVAIAGSKAGVIYVLNADNLGGFKMRASQTDATLQEITFAGSFYNGIGSYPGEGGYVYMCTTGGALHAYMLIFNNASQPNFQFAGQSSLLLGCRGTPTVTSLNGTPGTAIVWLADTSKGLVAFNAVPVNPGPNGVLTELTVPKSGGLSKFQRPTFGNNRAYIASTGKVIAIGGTPGPSTAGAPVEAAFKKPALKS